MKKNNVTLKGTIYPSNFFMIETPEGEYKWFDADPFALSAEERGKHEINLDKTLIDAFGHCSMGNPMVILIKGGVLDRCAPFDVTMPMKVRCGQIDRHFEDGDGCYVDILERRNGDPEYPFNGVVLDGNGDIVTTRKYSVRGICADGHEEHSIFVVRNERQEVSEEKDGDETSNKAKPKAGGKKIKGNKEGE